VTAATGDSAGPRFGAQVALLAAARLSSVAAFFAVSVVGARLLAPEALGSAAVGQTVGMIAGLIANAGINISTIYFLQQRPAQRPSLVRNLVAIAIGAGATAVLVVLLAAPIVFGLVLDRADWALLAAAAAMGATMIAFEFSGALLLGLERPGRFTMLELVRGWGSLAGVALLLIGPLRTDAGLVTGLALGYAAAAVMGLGWTRRSGLSLAPRADPEFTRTALGFGLRGQIGNVFQFLGVRLDLLLVPALLDLRSAGVYFVAVRVSDVVGQAATAASSLVFPRVAALSDRRQTTLTERVTRLTLWLVAGTAIVLALLGEIILRVAFGEEYVGGAVVLPILLLAVLPLSVGRILAADLKGRGRPELVSIAALAAVTATFAFQLALIPLLGLRGAGLAAVLAHASSAVILLVAYRSVTGARLSALVPRPSDLGELATMARSARGPGDAAT
jgi:O-antigen/teichoic acid export membrane protein